MIKVLAIGNSFSQDALAYLHGIAEAGGVEIEACNLFIGGCSLEQHWNNILSGEAAYEYEKNGQSTGTYISIEAALCADEWDYVVTQQASHDSGMEQSYFPYIEDIAAFIRKKAPGARLALHQTWAYESDSLHPAFARYDYSQQEMFNRLSRAYSMASTAINAPLITSGGVIQILRGRPPFNYGHGGMSLCRDGFHMNIIYGRYLLGAVWYRFLTGNSLADNAYIPRTALAPNAVCDGKIIGILKGAVDELVRREE